MEYYERRPCLSVWKCFDYDLFIVPLRHFSNFISIWCNNEYYQSRLLQLR